MSSSQGFQDGDSHKNLRSFLAVNPLIVFLALHPALLHKAISDSRCLDEMMPSFLVGRLKGWASIFSLQWVCFVKCVFVGILPISYVSFQVQYGLTSTFTSFGFQEAKDLPASWLLPAFQGRRLVKFYNMICQDKNSSNGEKNSICIDVRHVELIKCIKVKLETSVFSY